MERQSTFFSDKNIILGGWIPSGPVLDLGLTDYTVTRALQLKIHACVVADPSEERILLTEHYPVYTCGRRTRPEEKPRGTSIPVIDVERGGQMTYHGPGQIVGYPILNLAKRKWGIPRYLRNLENTLIEALQELGIEAEYREEHRAGLWVGEKKLVSIGIAVRRWVSFHGFALNVDCDLEPFTRISPCGLSGDALTNLRELGCTAAKEEVREKVIQKLRQF